jgi:hypothetical protein
MSSEELVSRLRKAIYERHVVRFSYAGGRVRAVEPHAVGVLTTGEECLLGYQTGGYSAPGSPPGWNQFEVSKIAGLIITKRVSSGQRPGYQRRKQLFQTLYAERRSVGDQRSGQDRRSDTDRRKKEVPIDFPDRRKGRDRRKGERRSGKDRRKGE